MITRGITLHVGLPKCASSALQAWACAHRDALADAGIDYPPAPAGLPAPKHQQMITGLLSGDLTPVTALLSRDAAPRQLLSSEGLSNHLYDFPPAHLSRLRDLFAGRCDTIVLMHRDPDEWIDSMWRQCLLNPYRPEFGYGLDLTREEFARLPRWAALQDHDQLSRDLAAAYAARRVLAIDIRDDWLAKLQQILGVDLPENAPAERRNVSINDDEAEFMRCVNGAGLSVPTRGRIMALMQRVAGSRNDVLAQQADRFGASLPAHQDELRHVLMTLRPSGESVGLFAKRVCDQLNLLTNEDAR